MTPKQKSKELFDKFLPLVEAFSCEGQTENAKQCALILVDEILPINSNPKAIEYWQEVKQNIEKL